MAGACGFSSPAPLELTTRTAVDWRLTLCSVDRLGGGESCNLIRFIICLYESDLARRVFVVTYIYDDRKKTWQRFW